LRAYEASQPNGCTGALDGAPVALLGRIKATLPKQAARTANRNRPARYRSSTARGKNTARSRRGGTDRKGRARPQRESEIDEKVAFETQRIADYTARLAWFTLLLFVIAILQAGLFVWQLQLFRNSLSDAKRAANAAGEAADAAKAAAEHIPKTERAYIFLRINIEDHIRPFVLGPSGDLSSHSEVEFGFKNHGRTPAIVEELHTNAEFWPKNSGWPALTLTRKAEIQKGLAISGGDTVNDYTIKFPVTREQIELVINSEGYILFWGKIVYLDVFRERHETGWCRATQFKGWRFAGDEKLNYYT
jgi:hypothetical protein